jgi:hypothetical protein
MVSYLYAALALLPVALLFYIWIFIFVIPGGAGPSGKPYDNFIMKICSSSDLAFFRTILTWGYFKRSFKTFYKFYKLALFPVPFAKLGGVAPDAKLVDLDGNSKSLLLDYIKKCPPSIPLILNMGSYT